jgi:hypothetical protein
MIQFLVDLHDIEKSTEFAERAFNYSERAKARSMLDLLAQGRIDINKGISSELKAKKSELDQALVETQRAIRGEAQTEKPDDSVINRLDLKLDSLKSIHEDLRLKIVRNNPAYAMLTGTKEPLTLKEVQGRVLREDQVLLQYLIADSTSFLFIVKADTMHIVKIALAREELEKMVSTFLAPLRDVGNIMDIKFDFALAHQCSGSEQSGQIWY